MIDALDLHRFEDDGGPPGPDYTPPTHIGIATAPPSEPPELKIVLGGGDGLIQIPAAVETPEKLTWKSYCDWRRTKCRPYDYDQGPVLATVISDTIDPVLAARSLEEIDQATHEVVGEAAELGELFFNELLDTFYASRSKLIDECGDILFCACWALDAWGNNPLASLDSDQLELIAVDPNELVAMIRAALRNGPQIVSQNQGFMDALALTVQTSLSGIMTGVGLTANAFKKLRFQRRQQDVGVQVKRILGAMHVVNQILYIASSNMEDAMRANMKKLNYRWPRGTGDPTTPPGGFREGDGK